MIENQEQYLKKTVQLEESRATLRELKHYPSSDVDNRFYELYVQTTEKEITEAEAEIAEYEARHKEKRCSSSTR